MLVDRGIPTAAPLALIKQKGSADDWMITRYVDGAFDLDRVVLSELPRLSPSRQRCVKDRLIVKLAALHRLLRENRVVHRDLKASNVLVTNFDRDDPAPELWLIDMEGIRSGVVSPKQFRRSFVRLVASIMDYRSVTRTDLARLLKCCSIPSDSSPPNWRVELRDILASAQAYNDLARKRKTNKLDGYQ